MPVPEAGGRDLRLDLFRGLALVMMFIDHVPGTVYERLTMKNFGLSDAAEGFVLMSGIAAGLAYTGRFQQDFWRASARAWARARAIYLAHIATTLIAIAIVAAASLGSGLSLPVGRFGVAPLLSEPLGTLADLALMTYHLPYFNILPLYVVLMLALPLLLPLALRAPVLLLGASVAAWAVAGQFGINFPATFGTSGWLFNPLSWQLIFVIGLLAGTQARLGKALVAYRPALFWGAVAILVFGALWGLVASIREPSAEVLFALGRQGLTRNFVFDKTYLALIRLLHALALAYVLFNLPVIARIAAHRYAAPLVVMGRHSLTTVAVGSIIGWTIQHIRVVTGSDDRTDLLLLGLGVTVMVLLAYALESFRTLPTRDLTLSTSSPPKGAADARA